MEPKMHELTVSADIDRLHEVLAFVDELFEAHVCPMKAQMQIEVALEELFVNIAHYAYTKGTGEATIRVNITPEFIEITLIDSGIPYDPLKKPDPDVTLSAHDRPIGGLGIFMTKKLMDDVSYEYKDGKNHLTIKKLFK